MKFFSSSFFVSTQTVLSLLFFFYNYSRQWIGMESEQIDIDIWYGSNPHILSNKLIKTQKHVTPKYFLWPYNYHDNVISQETTGGRA